MKRFFIFTKLFFLLAASIGLSTVVRATDTFERVRNIVQAKCTNGCHTAASPSGLLILNGDAASLYAALVNVPPTNPEAVNKGYKRVVAGRADQSFFLKKINGGLEHNFNLSVEEGQPMPPYGAGELTMTEKELIRQWIIFGAPLTGEVTNEALIEDYYAAGTAPVTPLPLLDPSEGFQLHHGPIFMAPGHELEAFRKIDLTLPDSLDIVGFDISMNQQSHHFVIYQYNPTIIGNIPAGIRISSGFADEIVMYQNASFLDIWQFAERHEIPDIAAFKWGTNTSIDFNYHIKNYSATTTMAAEAYINIYTAPKDPTRRSVKFAIAPYGGGNPFILNLPPTGTDTTIAFADHTPEDKWIGIWKIQGHTHRLGQNYNIFLRNPDGTKGEHLYNGFFNSTHTINQGYYDYSHPPVLKKEPLMCLNRKDGLIHEAIFNNDTGEPVTFGFTTNEEMFVTYYTYVDLDPSEIPCETLTDVETISVPNAVLGRLQVAPNPSMTTFQITYTPAEQGHVAMEVRNLLGERVAQLINGTVSSNQVTVSFDASHLAAGIYLLTIQTPNGIQTERLVKMD